MHKSGKFFRVIGYRYQNKAYKKKYDGDHFFIKNYAPEIADQLTNIAMSM